MQVHLLSLFTITRGKYRRAYGTGIGLYATRPLVPINAVFPFTFPPFLHGPPPSISHFVPGAAAVSLFFTSPKLIRFSRLSAGTSLRKSTGGARARDNETVSESNERGSILLLYLGHLRKPSWI